MILYKYRSLVNFERILDIILNQRLYCSTYPELNDPFEGIFETINYRLAARAGAGVFSPARTRALVELHGKTFKKAEELFGGEIDKIKICSLSSDLNDVRLWSYYADGHRGVVFGIDFSGLETKIHEIQYFGKLSFGRTFLGQTLLRGLSPYEKLMGRSDSYYELTQKTNHWQFESEHRIIDEIEHLEEGKHFDIKGRIKTIYLGTRISTTNRDLLTKMAKGKIPIYSTKLNEEKIIVEPDKLIEG